MRAKSTTVVKDLSHNGRSGSFELMTYMLVSGFTSMKEKLTNDVYHLQRAFKISHPACATTGAQAADNFGLILITCLLDNVWIQ